MVEWQMICHSTICQLVFCQSIFCLSIFCHPVFWQSVFCTSTLSGSLLSFNLSFIFNRSLDLMLFKLSIAEYQPGRKCVSQFPFLCNCKLFIQLDHSSNGKLNNFGIVTTFRLKLFFVVVMEKHNQYLKIRRELNYRKRKCSE